MSRDPASEILDLVDARCVITGGLRTGGDWSYRFRPGPQVKLDAVVSGSCWLLADDEPPVRLNAGDAAVLCGVRTAVLCSEPALAPASADRGPRSQPGFFAQLGGGSDVVIMGGHIETDPESLDLFTSALPRVLHADGSGDEARKIRRLLESIADEMDNDRPGSGFAASHYAQLLLLEALRVGMRHREAVPPGWLRLLADARLRPAVVLMHADPGRSWQLAELAAAASLSRSHFAQRFRDVSGYPPLAYLSRWRISLAQRALRTSDMTIAALAENLGYASESSFTHAFTRVAGLSPSRYRQSR